MSTYNFMSVVACQLRIVNCRLLIAYCLLHFGCQSSSAQTTISLQAAIDTALKNNLSFRGQQLNADYQKKLRGTAYNIPQTNAILDYGQINSAYQDNKFSIQQSIKFPTVYAKQRSLYNEEWNNSLLSVAVKENELRKQVSLVYYEMLYLQRKQKLLEHADSIFSAFLQNAELRFNKGESNILEKVTAETQRGHIGIQLRESQGDFSMLKVRLAMLLNTNVEYVPANEALKASVPSIVDTSTIRQHPVIKQLQTQEQIGLARWRLEKSKLLPDLFASYNSTTIKGFGADSKFYSGSDRFQSFQIGVGIPLFFGSQHSSSSAMKLSYLASKNNYQQGLQSFQAAYGQALIQYNKTLQAVQYYEGLALKNAEIIVNTANLQFRNGDINYLEWVLLTNNAIAIQSEYLDTVKELNASIIEISSYTTK